MLTLEWLAQQRVVEQVNLRNREVIGGLPVALYLAQGRGRERPDDCFLPIGLSRLVARVYRARDAHVEVIGGRHRAPSSVKTVPGWARKRSRLCW